MNFNDFVGHKEIKKDLLVHIDYSIKTGMPFVHTIFFGSAGLGKTTLAEIIANELGVGFIQRTGEDLTKEVLFEILERIQYGDIFFIDEIHATRTKVLEILYGPLQIINRIQLLKEKRQSFYFEDKTIHPFSLIGSTTSAGQIVKPLRDRFILNYRLNPYTVEELKEILVKKSCPPLSAKAIALRSRGTPREAEKFFLRVRNEVKGMEKRITPNACLRMFKRQKIDAIGLTEIDRKILQYLKINGKMSELQLYRTLQIDKKDFSSIYESYLLHIGFIRVTSRGRVLTNEGLQYCLNHIEGNKNENLPK